MEPLRWLHSPNVVLTRIGHLSFSACYRAVQGIVQPVNGGIISLQGSRCLGEIDRFDAALMRQHGELIDVPPDGFQLKKSGFQFLHLVDGSPKRGTQKVFALRKSRLGDQLFDLLLLGLADPKGHLFVSRAAAGHG